MRDFRRAHKVARIYFDLEDMESVAMEALTRCARDYDPAKGRLSTSAYTCVRNALLGMIDQRYRDKNVIERNTKPFSHYEKNDFVFDPPAPEQTDDEAEAKQLVECAFKVLDERSIEVLRMRYFDGLTCREVGNRLGISKERVRQIEQAALRRAKRHLREIQP